MQVPVRTLASLPLFSLTTFISVDTKYIFFGRVVFLSLSPASLSLYISN